MICLWSGQIHVSTRQPQMEDSGYIPIPFEETTQDLNQRPLNRPKHNTGISRLIEKSNYSLSDLEKEFQKRLEKRNVKGFFRLPDIGKGEHIIIDNVEKEEEKEEEEEYDDLTQTLREEQKKIKEDDNRRKKAIEDMREYRERLIKRREEAEDKSEDLNEDTVSELEEEKLEREEKMMRDIEKNVRLIDESHKKELIQKLYGGDEKYVHVVNL